jgi:hypothetical protein
MECWSIESTEKEMDHRPKMKFRGSVKWLVSVHPETPHCHPERRRRISRFFVVPTFAGLLRMTTEKKVCGWTPVILLVILIGGFYSTFAQAVAPEGKPVVEIPSPRHDAGTHWEGEVVSHSFEVKNTGSSELRILNVKPG